MRKLMFAFCAGVIVWFASCLKNDTTPTRDCTPPTATAPESEVAALKTYLDTNNITATQDSRGFFYNIDSFASTVAGHPTDCSDVSVAYVAKLTNGTTVDSQSVERPVSFGLYGNIITGWKEAIPLMKSNSVMTLYLPPSLAYGASGSSPVPGNANLVFTIKLLAFN